jgi:hypothetical protein
VHDVSLYPYSNISSWTSASRPRTLPIEVLSLTQEAADVIGKSDRGGRVCYSTVGPEPPRCGTLHAGIGKVSYGLSAPYGARLGVIGSVRRDMLDHVIVFNAQHLRCLLTDYLTYSHRFRTHLSLGMDCPEPQPVEPPEYGKVVAVPEVGGLQHHYERRAAGG